MLLNLNIRNMLLICSLAMSSTVLPMYQRDNLCSICYDNQASQKLSCRHSFCADCLQQQFSIGIREKSKLKLRCPGLGCKRLVSLSELEAAGFSSQELALAKEVLNPKRIDASAQDNNTKRWSDGRAKNCPACNVLIEKNGGCNHITCHRCAHDFCWVCLAPTTSAYHCSNNKSNWRQSRNRSTALFFRNVIVPLGLLGLTIYLVSKYSKENYNWRTSKF